MSTGSRDLPRPRIYQLMVRHFGNTNETRRPGGTLEENGCGRFADLDEAALAALADLGITHLWLTGVLEQASGTAYPHRPADDPDILKGLAGSPYAITDYFDLCPDYALEPENRREEFHALLERCQAHRLVVLIDLVPNHVARSYGSDVQPEHSFGLDDDRTQFFSRDNNFFYLGPHDPGGGPPLRLPATGPGCDGIFPAESDHGRVTGNNARTWTPSIYDWYETVKLNYGHDYTTGHDTSHLPGPGAEPAEVPDTWRKMDAVIASWQELGVGGFRVDMAHMVPLEFWHWVVGRARRRNGGAFFMAEAYDTDPAKLTEGNVLDELLAAGFDAVYDDPAYRILQGIYEGPKWANDIDHVIPRGERFHSSLRYAENHDEVRLANPQHWAGLGSRVGRPVCAILFGLGSGPVMIYNGQEVGEPATGAEGFAGDDGRTSIFDYWCLPELARWVNGHRYDGGGLSPEQRALRSWYGALLQVCAEPAFAKGVFRSLNGDNVDNPAFGRVGEESSSGHWLYAFLRFEEGGGQAFLVVVNLHGEETLRGVRVRLPRERWEELGLGDGPLRLHERLSGQWAGEAVREEALNEGIALADLPPCSACYLELERP